METKSAVSAAHFLLQIVEAKLPNRKKNVAVTEFKHAVISHKRRSKAHLVEEGQIIYKNKKIKEGKVIMLKRLFFPLLQVHCNFQKMFLCTFSVFLIRNLWFRRG